MKKIGKIFAPILSGLATIGVVAPLITACSKNTKKYEVNIVNATGVTGEVIQNEFGKNITIKYHLERGYDINKDQVKYIVGTGAAKDPIINETSNEIIINYDSKWPENAAIKLVLASINLEYKITIDPDDHITTEIKEQHMGKPIEIEFHSDFAYSIDQSASWVKYGNDPVTTGLEWSTNKLTIREQLSWTDKTQITVHFETNHEQIPEDNFVVTPDDGFDGYGITTRYLDEDIIISYTLKQYFDFNKDSTTVEIDGWTYTKWETQGDSGIRIEKPDTGWTTGTRVAVNFASDRQVYENLSIDESHVGFTNPKVTNDKVGENITIKCGLNDGYIWNKANVTPELDPEFISYDPATDILTIIPDSSWTKKTEIKVQLVADELFTGLTVDSDEGFGEPEIIQHIVGKPIVIKCNTISSKCYRFDENNIDIVAPTEPESATYDSTEDTLTIVPNADWGQTTSIAVTLHSYQEFRDVTVTGDDGFGEPTVEKKTVGDEIVIKCNIKTTEGYLFDEEKLEVSPTPSADPIYDPATDTLTIVPNEVWKYDQRISVKLYSYQEFSDIDVDKDEGFGEPEVTERLFGQPIVIKCNIKTTEGYLFDEEKLEVSPKPTVDPTYDSSEDTLTIVPDEEWSWDEEISVKLYSYQEFGDLTVIPGDDGFGAPEIMEEKVGRPIVIKCNTKTAEGYLFDEDNIDIEAPGLPQSVTYDSTEDTLTIVPNVDWVRGTEIKVTLHSYQEFINLNVEPAEEDSGFDDPEIMEGKVGRPIVIKCNTKTTEGYLFNEDNIDIDAPSEPESATYDSTEDTLTIVPNANWVRGTEIKVTLHSYQGFTNISLSHDQGYGEGTVAKAVVGGQIVINCNSHGDVDYDGAVINAEPAYEGPDPVYNKDTDTLTFDAMEGWNWETPITVALSSKVGITVDAGATTLDGGFGSDGHSSTPITATLTTGSGADVTTNTTFVLVDGQGQPYSEPGISIGEITGEKYITWNDTVEAGQYEFYVKGTYNLDDRAVEKSNKVTLTIHKMKIGYSSEAEPYEIAATAGVEGSDTQTVNIDWDDTTSEQVDPTKLAVSLIDASSEQTIEGLSIEYDSSATAWRIKWTAHEADTEITFKIRATYTNEFTTSIDSTFTIKITFVV